VRDRVGIRARVRARIRARARARARPRVRLRVTSAPGGTRQDGVALTLLGLATCYP